MSFQLTATAKALSRQNLINPQIILEIDGIPVIFGAEAVLSIWRLDEGFFLDTGLRLDTPTEDPKSRDFISLAGSTKNITQQITPDKSGTSSISSVNINLIDKNQELSRLFKFGNYVNDILSRPATVYMSFKGASHPEDSIPIFRGYIDDYSSGGGNFTFSIAHPENKKRTTLFNQYKDELVNDINNSATAIDVSSTSTFIPDANILTGYIKIDDEYMKVVSYSETQFEVIRGQLNSPANSHDASAEISSVYKLVSDPIDMLLKLYLSKSGNNFSGSEIVKSINQINTNIFIQNAISFGETDISAELGLVDGDFVKLENSIDPLNDGEHKILEINSVDGLFYAVVDSDLQTVTEEIATASFKSQFNVLSEGVGLTGREVDVQGHLDIEDFNPNTFPILDFQLEDSIEVKEFCDKEIMFPVSLYSLPRKARISLKLVQPPLSLNETIVLDETNITNLDKVKTKRSVNRYLYNTIVYKYEKLIGTDRFLRGRIITNEDSENRIDAGNKQLTITSLGLRNNTDTDQLLLRQTSRLFDRYQFAAQQIDNVIVQYRDGYNIEIGDVIVFGGDNVQITDLNTGERIFKQRLMEVINRDLNFVDGKVRLSLLETAFGLEARYGVVSPSSKLDIGSTATELKVKASFASEDDFTYETDKWKPFVNNRIRIRNDDYSYDEVAEIAQIKPTDNSIIVLKNPLPLAPSENYILEVPEYDDDISIDETYKDQFVFKVSQVKVTTVIDNISFEVDRPDDLFVESNIYIHSENYDRDSFIEKPKIESIIGNIVTLDLALSFVPQIDDLIEKSNFKDGSFPYLLV